MEKLAKRISALPAQNKIDVVGLDTGELAIKANDVEYIEDRTYKGKVKGFNGQWIWIGLFVFVFVLFLLSNKSLGIVFVCSIFWSICGGIYIYIITSPLPNILQPIDKQVNYNFLFLKRNHKKM